MAGVSGCSVDESTDAIRSVMTYSSTKATDGVSYAEIDFSRVRLGGNIVATGKTSFVAEKLVQLVAFTPIPVEYLLENECGVSIVNKNMG